MRLFLLTLPFIWILHLSPLAMCEETGGNVSTPPTSSFLPIWKLLSPEQKQEFISGYLHGWRDAARVTEIAISFVRENPQQAVSGLERVQQLYEFGDIKPNQLVESIDRFYAKAENFDASLSVAVTAARNG